MIGEDEEASFFRVGLSKRDYCQFFFAAVWLASSLADAMCPHRLCPQCFCAGDLVAEIVKELKTRMKARGDTGQIKRAEQLLGEIQILKAQAQNTDAKLNAILKHLNIEAPPPTASAVTQQPLA